MSNACQKCSNSFYLVLKFILKITIVKPFSYISQCIKMTLLEAVP
nr:MAG TPA: hypothetical protein [Caudoviricetes sp.]